MLYLTAATLLSDCFLDLESVHALTVSHLVPLSNALTGVPNLSKATIACFSLLIGKALGVAVLIIDAIEPIDFKSILSLTVLGIEAILDMLISISSSTLFSSRNTNGS